MSLPPYLTEDHHIESPYSKPLEMTETSDISPKRKSSPLCDQILHHPEKKHKSTNGVSSRDDRFIYGNPKDIIKSPPLDGFESHSALDLSCKSSKSDDEKMKRNDLTYQNFPRNNHPYLPEPFPRSNLEIKLVNSSPKRPSTTEQLQIAKIQQQQRRSIQQQQKMLQQMRRTLDSGGRSIPKPPSREPPEEEPKHLPLGGMFPHPLPLPLPLPPSSSSSSSFMDGAQGKELPDGHPVLPLLDPVYFSALYNAHGFMPPSSPSIAAAFIGTLQDALPKLSMMFPPTSSSAGSSLLHQKGGENLN